MTGNRYLRARRSSAFVPASFGPPAVSRSDVTRPLPPRWELVLPPPEVVDDARLLPKTAFIHVVLPAYPPPYSAWTALMVVWLTPHWKHWT